MCRAAERGRRCLTARCAAGSGNRGGMGRTRKLQVNSKKSQTFTCREPVFI